MDGGGGGEVEGTLKPKQYVRLSREVKYKTATIFFFFFFFFGGGGGVGGGGGGGGGWGDSNQKKENTNKRAMTPWITHLSIQAKSQTFNFEIWVTFDRGQSMTLIFDTHSTSLTHLAECFKQLWDLRLQ